MHLIIYTSVFAGRKDDLDSVLTDMFEELKANNLNSGITGSFFHHNFRFIVVLEGESDPLEQTMSMLAKDHRHKNIQRIVDQRIKKRGFKRWNFDTLNLSEDETIDIDELISIRNAYKKHLLVDSRLLVDFYKAMLALHALKPKKEIPSKSSIFIIGKDLLCQTAS
jgi:hypothetical protein